MTPILLYSLLLAPQTGIRVDVMGEGKLRFLIGRKVSTSAAATLAPNASGLLADETGRLITPTIRIGSGIVRIAMNGNVSVSGVKVGRLVLERTGASGAELGFPGEEGMGVLQIGASALGSSPTAPLKTNTPAMTTAPVPTSTTATVTLRASTEVAGDRVLLKDVADIVADPATAAKLGAVDLGALPSLGIRRTLGSWSVKAALRSQGIRDGLVTLNFPPDVTVTRKGQTIDDDTLVAEARAKAEAGIAGGRLSLVAGPAAMIVPCGEISYDASFERKDGVVVVTVKVSVDGKFAGQRPIKFTSSDTGIKIGDAVRITVLRNGASIETDGKAKSAGFVGGTIQVTTSAGATFSATVTASGTVEVKL